MGNCNECCVGGNRKTGETPSLDAQLDMGGKRKSIKNTFEANMQDEEERIMNARQWQQKRMSEREQLDIVEHERVLNEARAPEYQTPRVDKEGIHRPFASDQQIPYSQAPTLISDPTVINTEKSEAKAVKEVAANEKIEMELTFDPTTEDTTSVLYEKAKSKILEN